MSLNLFAKFKSPKRTFFTYALLKSALLTSLLTTTPMSYAASKSKNLNADAIEAQCVQKVKNVFTIYGLHHPKNPKQSQVEVVIVPEVAVEFEIENYFTRGMKTEKNQKGVTNYQFILKKNLCNPNLVVTLKNGNNVSISPEKMALLQVFATQYPQYTEQNIRDFAQGTAVLHSRLKAKGLLQSVNTPEQNIAEKFNEIKEFAPAIFDELDLVVPALKEYALARFAEYKKTGPEWEWETPTDNDKNTVLGRIKNSTVSANISACYGTMWANPDPNSIKPGACLNFYSMNDITKLLMDENKIPEYLRDRAILEMNAGGTMFTNGSTAHASMETISLNFGDDRNFEVFARHTAKQYTDFNEVCQQNTHCQKTSYPSIGFRYNVLNRREYLDNFFFSYELIKPSNKPFEADVIYQTSKSHPHWPLLPRAYDLTTGHPGLMLGYIIRAGFTATLVDNIPDLLPFLTRALKLKSKKGRIIVGMEVEASGSAIMLDDFDFLNFNFLVAYRHADAYTFGLKISHGSQMSHHDDDFEKEGHRRGVSTAMVFLTIPFKDFKYKDDDRSNIEPVAPSEFKITELQPYMRLFPVGKAFHQNYGELRQKATEEGVRVKAKWNHFTFDVSIYNTTPRTTQWADKADPFQTVQAFVKYTPSSSPNLNLVFAMRGDNYQYKDKDGHKEFGVGIELIPFKGTPIEKYVDFSVMGLFNIDSDYCAIHRCEQANLSPKIKTRKSGEINAQASRVFDIPWITEKTGFQVKFSGLYTTYFNEGFNQGYYSMSLRAAIKNDKVCTELGTTLYNQDGNFGAGSGDRPDAGPGQGQLGDHYDRYNYILVDGLCALDKAKSWWRSKETPTSTSVASGSEAKKSDKKEEIAPDAGVPVIMEKDIPTVDRDQYDTLKWLAAIAASWYRDHLNTPKAQAAYKMVPVLVDRLTDKLMLQAQDALKRNKPDLAIKRFEVVRQIYDTKMTLAEINATGDSLGDKLQWILRFTLGQDPTWKKSILAYDGSKKFNQAAYCMGVGFEMLGEQELANTLLAIDGQNACQRKSTLLTNLSAAKAIGSTQVDQVLSSITLDMMNSGKDWLRKQGGIEQAIDYFTLVVDSLDGTSTREIKTINEYYMPIAYAKAISSDEVSDGRLKEIKSQNQSLYDEAHYCLAVAYKAKGKQKLSDEHMAKIGSYKTPGIVQNVFSKVGLANHCEAWEDLKHIR